MPVTVRYIDSADRSHAQTLLAWLLAELPAAETLFAASAYFDASILDSVEPHIIDILRRGGQVHLTFGSNRGQTQREDLERALTMVTSSRRGRGSLAVVHIPDAVFHHKTYFIRRPGRVTALVGSPNFTTASVTKNVEAAVILEANNLEPPLGEISAAISPARVAGWANSYQISTARDLDVLAALGVIGVTPPPAPPPSGPPATATTRARRRRQRFPASQRVNNTPSPTARVRPTVPRAPAVRRAPVPPPITTVIFVFSGNDLKLTGTREFSVPAGVKDWLAQVLGGPVRVGQGELMRVNLLGRLVAAPNSVTATPLPVRIWSAGGTGGTHQDIRLVMGNAVRSALEEQSVLLFGSGLARGDIGVLELPANPRMTALKLTLYRPDDADYPGLLAMTNRVGRQQKPQAVVVSLPQLPPWPY